MSLKSFSFKTKDGFEHWVNRWIPEADGENPTKIKAVIVFNHGLAEHSLRYDRFGSILAEQGYVFNAFDMSIRSLRRTKRTFSAVPYRLQD